MRTKLEGEERDDEERGEAVKRANVASAIGTGRQINVRLMLLSTHSAAELRILDSQSGLSPDVKDFRRDFFYTSSFSSFPFSPRRSAVMKTFAHRHFNDFPR